MSKHWPNLLAHYALMPKIPPNWGQQRFSIYAILPLKEGDAFAKGVSSACFLAIVASILAGAGFADSIFPKLLIGLTQHIGKLVFVEYLLSLRASAHTGVAIPRLDGKCTDKHPKTWVPAIFGGNRYLVPWGRGIATTSVRTGLAMTAYFQTTICRTAELRRYAHFRIQNDNRRSRCSGGSSRAEWIPAW